MHYELAHQSLLDQIIGIAAGVIFLAIWAYVTFGALFSKHDAPND